MTTTIFYSDKIYEGPPEFAPTRDVQAIVQPCPHVGWAMQHTADYYVWRDDLDTWRGTDIFGLWDYLASDGLKKVLFGRTISTAQFDDIYQRAKQTRDEKKTGFDCRERKPAGIK